MIQWGIGTRNKRDDFDFDVRDGCVNWILIGSESRTSINDDYEF